MYILLYGGDNYENSDKKKFNGNNRDGDNIGTFGIFVVDNLGWIQSCNV